MTLILEHPWKIAIYGFIFTAVAVYVAVRFSEYRKLRRIPICSAILTAILIAVSILFMTEGEKVREHLYSAAEAVENADIVSVVDHIHPKSRSLRLNAQAKFERYKISAVSIKSNLEVRVDKTKEPREAVATFNVVVQGSDGSSFGVRAVPRYVEMKFKKDGNQWKITEIWHDEPTMSIRKESYKRQRRLEGGSSL